MPLLASPPIVSTARSRELWISKIILYFFVAFVTLSLLRNEVHQEGPCETVRTGAWVRGRRGGSESPLYMPMAASGWKAGAGKRGGTQR
jgi:hypothetical protein